ncbi:MSH2 protein [Malassezia cuniculi]|uniref:DNA mismatch repair protein MSH2 n=1 Tax=Malassezia cuniculi TaxID=948313 RepID=A0AAF0EQ03_9BASI|nr:MSH2 protein [Malassezia cuniculi]
MYPTEEARESRGRPDLGLDAKGESSFIEFFRKMPVKVEGTVRLFDRTDFFTAHGDDAIYVADDVFKTQSVIKHLGSKENGLASCTLSTTQCKEFLRRALTVNQLRVEIWLPEHGARRGANWKLARSASPGNLQEVEDLIFGDSDFVASPIVLALRAKMQDGQCVVGVAYADATNREMGVSEYVDNDLFTNTESLIIQLGAKECLMPADESNTDVDLGRLRNVVKNCGCVVSNVPRSSFSPRTVEQDLSRLVKDDTVHFDLKVALSSVAAIIQCLGLLADEDNFGRYVLHNHDLSEFLRLDHAALRALTLFPDPNTSGQNTSVFSLLNRCKTAQGVRMLGQWLKQPLVKEHAIRNRQILVQIFMDDLEGRQRLQDVLKYMPDMLRMSKRFQRGNATLEDVVRCYQAVTRIPEIAGILNDIPAGTETDSKLFKETFAEPIQELQDGLEKLVEMVETTIDLDELAYHNYVIKPEYDDDLKAIKQQIDNVRDKLDEQHAIAGQDLGMDTEKKLHLENHSSYGYCFRVTRIDGGVLKNRKGYLDLGTVKGGIYFTTEALRDLNDEFRSLSQSYSRTQSQLVRTVIEVAATFIPPLERLNVVIAQLDVLVSFAHVAANAPVPFTRPAIAQRGSPLVLTNSRHPCLEVQEDIHFIPNDVSLVPGESEFLVVTGPNMGGKSTYLRQIGVIVLLAQIGSFIPADEGASVPVCDCILARVGAGDSQLKGVSTFMAEMLETATILRTASRDSLILIDELGRGTSTYDGFGLAWAISEYIVQHIHSKCVFATHFHELTNLAKEQQGVKNLHVVAHVESRAGNSRYDRDITLLYKVEPGTSEQSYGIQIAELADFPDSVIQLAKRKAEELEDTQDVPNVLDASQEDTDAGIALVEDFMREWVKRARTDTQSPTQEQQAAALREVASEFEDRIRANPWTARVLENF